MWQLREAQEFWIDYEVAKLEEKGQKVKEKAVTEPPAIEFQTTEQVLPVEPVPDETVEEFKEEVISPPEIEPTVLPDIIQDQYNAIGAAGSSFEVGALE